MQQGLGLRFTGRAYNGTVVVDECSCTGGVIRMSYTKYGISPQLVERVKVKMKNPLMKDRVKRLLEGVTKQDLQDRAVVHRLVRKVATILNENLTDTQEDQIVKFVIAQRIDPKNTFHLIKLWGMFR